MEPRGPLYAEYLRLIEEASARGLTDPRGLTPREHERRLADVLPPADLRRLHECFERSAYGCREEGTVEALALCLELTEAVRALPLPPPPSAPRRALRLPKRFLGRILFAAAIVVGIFSLSAAVKDLSLSNRSGGHVRGVEKLTSDEERSAVESARGSWSRPEHRPSFITIDAPDVIGPGQPFGFDTLTGIDGDFPNWRDPMSPPLSAHHRTSVYTSIDASYRFGATDLPLRDAAARAGEPPGAVYDVSVTVRMPRGRPVPVPSPAPDSRVLSSRTSPAVNVKFFLDRGQGLRVVSDWTGTYGLRYRVTARRGYESAPLPNTPMDGLELETMPLPENVRADAGQVLAAIGDVPAGTYAATVRRLHAYFSGFGIAPIRPRERKKNDYLTVSLARKGCCRHRASAFVVTANAAGIPARLVTNEIHAFAEVMLPDGTWRLIELRVLDAPRSKAAIGATPRDTTRFAGMMALFAVSIFACLLLWRDRERAAEHVIGGAGRRTRSDRRAVRDRALHGQDLLMERLLDAVVLRLCERLRVPPEELAVAIEASEMPLAVQARARNLLDFRPEHGRDPYSLKEAHWDAKAVVSWIEGGADGQQSRES